MGDFNSKIFDFLAHEAVFSSDSVRFCEQRNDDGDILYDSDGHVRYKSKPIKLKKLVKRPKKPNVGGNLLINTIDLENFKNALFLYVMLAASKNAKTSESVVKLQITFTEDSMHSCQDFPWDESNDEYWEDKNGKRVLKKHTETEVDTSITLIDDDGNPISDEEGYLQHLGALFGFGQAALTCAP